MVLRTPENNCDKAERAGLSSVPPKISDTYYAGVDRMPWFDLTVDYHDGVLSAEFVSLKKELNALKNETVDYYLVEDINKAKKILDYSNSKRKLNEIAVIYSQDLEKKIGSFESPVAISWLGTDIYCHGYGSLLREGLFRKSEIFTGYVELLNKHGLFDFNNKLIDEYISAYTKLSHIHNLEIIDGALSYIDKVAIGRVNNR